MSKKSRIRSEVVKQHWNLYEMLIVSPSAGPCVLKSANKFRQQSFGSTASGDQFKKSLAVINVRCIFNK